MKNSITPNQIKQNNKKLIYQYLYKNKKASQQELCFYLHLSRPTVTTNLSELEADGLIAKCGQMDTEYVGRKAAAYSIVADYHVSIGVEILKNEIKIIAVDLYGNKIKRLAYPVKYQNEDAYFALVCGKILSFIAELKLTSGQILGIGFAMQALIAPDAQTVVYGKILDCTGLSITAFTKYLPYPCAFFHDADSAAVSELWVSADLKDAFYLSISNHLGAAIICNGRILTGKHGHNATVEHLPLKPDGETCYCGKIGCIDTLCSLSALLDEEETLEDFFEKLRTGDIAYGRRWDDFLANLALAVNMIHLIYDTDFILGGYLAPYLCQEDIVLLYEKIKELTPFPEKDDFIQISKMPKHNITIGAALPYIQEFLNHTILN